MLTAAYLINKMPTPVLGHKSPHQILFDTPPMYSSLRVFGCLCFAKNMSIKSKFDARANPGVFIGYPYGQKGYRVYDITTGKIYTSRDVIFHEFTFPYPDIPTTTVDSPVSVQPILDDDTFHFFSSQNSSLPELESPSGHDNLSASSTMDDVFHPPDSVVTTRFPLRDRRPPSHLKDYICSSISPTTKSPIANYLSLSHFKQQHRVFFNKYNGY